MQYKLPNKVWVLEDQKDVIQSLNKFFGEKRREILMIENKADNVRLWFADSEAPPDVLLLDVCLEWGDEDIVITPKKNFQNLSELTGVSGIKFLNWLRSEWPRLPAVAMSAYWKKEQENPNLSQHAICFVQKPIPTSITSILWIAQQAIIGIRLPENLRGEAQNILNEVNQIQNHFFFILCNNEKNLVSPPEFLSVRDESQLVLLFGTWNNRVLGLMEDDSLIKNSISFHPILPFSRVPLRRFPIRLSNEVDYMGENYLSPYLLRECARAAYLLFFNIKSHPIGTGQCIFDNSTYAPDLIPGILREEGICPDCDVQRCPQHAFGGWSTGREKAAKEILKLAKKKLEEITSVEGEE
jgi:CheY-like chemotaxis protein